MSSSQITLAIIAGGKSKRMGRDKAFVPLRGKPMIAHVIERLQALEHPNMMLITNQPADYAHLSLPTFSDLIPHKGALGGIHTALAHSRTPYTLVVACDMPFLNVDLLRYMIGLLGENAPYDVIVPRVEGYPQGTHAIYAQTCQDAIRRAIEADLLKLSRLFDHLHVRYIDEPEYAPFDSEGRSFININTPEQLTEHNHLS